jgi:hypothetical protein
MATTTLSASNRFEPAVTTNRAPSCPFLEILSTSTPVRTGRSNLAA